MGTVALCRVGATGAAGIATCAGGQRQAALNGLVGEAEEAAVGGRLITLHSMSKYTLHQIIVKRFVAKMSVAGSESDRQGVTDRGAVEKNQSITVTGN